MFQISSFSGKKEEKRTANKVCTHIDLTEDHVHNAAHDDEEIEDVPGVPKVSLWRHQG